MAGESAQPTQTIESKKDFPSDSRGKAARWILELDAAQKEFKKRWHRDAARIVKRFLDNRGDSSVRNESRLNLFTANVQTQRALMFGKTPKVDVVRRWEDPRDQVGRVVAMMLERMLNLDVEEGSDGYEEALGLALDEKQLVGLGMVRLRYECETEEQEGQEAVLHPETGEELAPAVPPQTVKTHEQVCIDHIHWRDVLWSPSRTWGDVRWIAYRVYMSKEEVKKRFPKADLRSLPFSKKKLDDSSLVAETLKADPWQRIEIWEVWSREDEAVYWLCKGYDRLLDEKEDPLGLEGFFPSPRPLIANVTTDSFMPRPDFMLAQDLYNEIDYVSTRITMLERAVKCVGVYDKSHEGVTRMMTEGFDNDLIGIENYAALAEKGGIEGAISWLPLDKVVQALDKLREYRSELVKLLYEVTGLSDIMRGQAEEKGATATEQALKARFASVRMQHEQDIFANFATEVLELKAEIIQKHFDVATIIEQSNIQNTPDAQMAMQAAQALKEEKVRFRVEVKPENLSITDFSQLKEERTSYLSGLTMFLQAAAPVIQNMPQSVPYLMELLKFGLSAYRGGATLEPVLDAASKAMVQSLMQQQMNPKPDPKMAMAQAKVEGEKARAQADIAVTHAKLQGEQQKQQVQVQAQAQKANIDLQKSVAQLHLHSQQQVQKLAANMTQGVGSPA